MKEKVEDNGRENLIRISLGKVILEGNLSIPKGSSGLVIFAHGSGSSRFSPRNRHVGWALRKNKLATFLFDLLTKDEEKLDDATLQYRFDIGLLSERVIAATDWLTSNKILNGLNIGYFGASTGAAAALVAAAKRTRIIKAVVSRGGRPDLAKEWLEEVTAPTLLLVGENDPEVIDLNRKAMNFIHAEKKLTIIPKATHLFEEPGALEEVARLAAEWFLQYLPPGNK